MWVGDNGPIPLKTYQALGQSIYAADLGLTNDPAMSIAGLATIAGKNQDPWSQYALTHQKYSATDNPEFWQGAADLRKSLPDIQSYEAKDPFDTFMEKYAPFVPLAVAGAGYLSGLGGASGALGDVAAEQAAAPVFDAAMTPISAEGASGIGAGAVSESGGAGYFGGIGSSGAAGSGYSIPGFGGAAGSSAIPEIGIGGAAGSSATPALFSGSELATAFPGAYAASNAPGALSNAFSIGKTASSLSDIAKAIGNNAGAVGALIGSLTGKKPETVSGASSRPAWMNQGLPSIPQRQMVSNKIQGDPYRYGMGPQQALYTDQSGQVYQPQNFGMVGGQQFGIPIAKAHGGSIHGEGGLSRAFNYVEGGGNGQADDVPAKLSSGEYVMDADIVSALGDGNNDAGAKILDKFRENIRKHKRGAAVKDIPPKAKPVQQYLKGAK
jgi:hypothetical protein